jgi:hypothetical protein
MGTLSALGAAVIAQAVKDALRGDAEARAWLLDESGTMAFWCDAANLEADYVGRLVRERLTDYDRKRHTFDKAEALSGGAAIGAYHQSGGG